MEKFTSSWCTLNFNDCPIYLDPCVYPRQVPFLGEKALNSIAGVLSGPNPVSEACATKVVLSGVMGYLMGNGLGLVFGSYESIAPPIPLPGERELPKVPMSEQLKHAWRGTAEKCRYWGKSFGVVTGVECLVEKTRGQHDIINGTLAGCATGAALAAGQGPQAMCLGCAGFAAFSAAIEHLMGH